MMQTHEHEFARKKGSNDAWKCTRCKMVDPRSEIEFMQDEVKNERNRIIELLEKEARECEKAGLWANGSELRAQLQELHLGLNAAISLIKDEANDGIN